MAAESTVTSCGIELPSVLEYLTEPSIIIDDDHRIVAANQAYRDMFAGGERVCGSFCYETSHNYPSPCDELGESCPLEHCRRTGEASRVLHVHHTAQGAERHVVTTHPLTNATGEVSSYLEVIRPSNAANAESSREGLVGRSRKFNRMLELASRVAPTDATVLLNGESGTGKELLANLIHAESSRAEANFVPLDCSGLTESLFDSELFGHEKGAFTGAFQRHRGLVEASRGGTLFLDEVGDIPLTLQVKLLRLLETGTFRRVGSTERREVDFRLICASHRDLEAMAKAGTFRQDLYYRISVFPIRLPPLRERLDDLPLLIANLKARIGYGDKELHRDTLDALASYSFPGNVRELLNILTQSCLMADGGTILPEHLPAQCLEAVPGLGELAPRDEVLPLTHVESRYLRWAAARIPDNRSELARRLGVSERSLYRKLGRLRSLGDP